MKKIIYFFSALALMAGFTACEKPNNDGPNFDNIVLDGFYVYGEATGTNEILATNGMAAGNNEAAEGKPVRVGMYEKYIVLEAGKDFYLTLNEAGESLRYSAELQDIVDDYMLSFYNYYGITQENEPERYEVVLNTNLYAMLYHVTDVNSYEELTQVDLESAVTKYVLDAGMSEEDILTLKTKLS